VFGFTWKQIVVVVALVVLVPKALTYFKIKI
jgi:hypothetical protein